MLDYLDSFLNPVITAVYLFPVLALIAIYAVTIGFDKAIARAYKNEITGGYSDGTFKPTDDCPREHIVLGDV